MNQLNEELQSVQAEKDALLSGQSTAVQSSAEEELRSTVTSLTAERDQLHVSLQEHVDMVRDCPALFQSIHAFLLFYIVFLLIQKRCPHFPLQNCPIHIFVQQLFVSEADLVVLLKIIFLGCRDASSSTVSSRRAP